MKKSAYYSAMGVSILLMGPVMAAPPPTTLKVVGQFGAENNCLVSLSGENGELQWKGVSLSQLHPTKPLRLPGKTKMVSVDCELPTPLSFRVIDNRKGTSDTSAPQHFGLGNVNQTGKVGHYEAMANLIKVNGLPAGLATQNSVAKAFHYFTPDEVVYWGRVGGNEVVAGKAFAFELGIVPSLASLEDMEGLPVEGENLLDGSMTLAFGFGV